MMLLLRGWDRNQSSKKGSFMGLNDGENRTKGENCTSIIYCKVAKVALLQLLQALARKYGVYSMRLMLLCLVGDRRLSWRRVACDTTPRSAWRWPWRCRRASSGWGRCSSGRRRRRTPPPAGTRGYAWWWPSAPPPPPADVSPLASWILYIAVIRDGLFPDSRPIVTPRPRNYGTLTSHRAPTRLLVNKATEHYPPLGSGSIKSWRMETVALREYKGILLVIYQQQYEHNSQGYQQQYEHMHLAFSISHSFQIRKLTNYLERKCALIN